VAAVLNHLTDRRVRVRTEGGTLRVNWLEDETVLLTASAEVVYEGRWLQKIQPGVIKSGTST
jgi:diaminopimelate epimerase